MLKILHPFLLVSMTLTVLFLPRSVHSQSIKAEARVCEDPLIHAIQTQQLAKITELIKSGRDLNRKLCASGTTALIEALSQWPSAIARDLITAGASPNLTADDGTSPLMSASWGCRDDVVALLLERGAQVNLKDQNGYSALMYASGAPNCTDGRIVAMLIRAGANLNEASKTGRTALIDAVWEGNEIPVLELLSAGASMTAQVKGDETALMIARDRKVGRKPSHDRILSILVSMQAVKKD